MGHMIDGVKIKLGERDQYRLRTHHLLQWKANGVDRNGEQRFIARWSGFTFKGNETRCTQIRGSLHKYYHGGTNWQDFTFPQFVEAVTSFCFALGIHDANLDLSNVEVGVNFIPPIPTANVLRSIVLHKGIAPVGMRKGNGIVIKHFAYLFKIYDKALHMVQTQKVYEGPTDLLRFELKVIRMRQLARFGVRTLADLMEPGKWDTLQQYVIGKFNELLIVEPEVHPAGLRSAEVELLSKASDVSYWVGLDKRRRSEKRKMLSGIYMRHAPNGLGAKLLVLITNKLEELNDSTTLYQDEEGIRTSKIDISRTNTPLNV